MNKITIAQARQFILLKQGLLGNHKFHGKDGALEFIRQAGCLQFDPIDICGRNAEITLQARVKGFEKSMLHDLLYRDRQLFDYMDKQLSIIPIEYWPYFEHFRQAARDNLKNHPEIEAHFDTVRAIIEAKGAVCSNDLELEGSTNWWSAINWSSGGKLSRSVLEQMYSSGDLVVHHKKGARKYYDIAEKHIPKEILQAANPLPGDFEHIKWRVLRRIGAVGLLWNRASDAWLGIWGMTADIRSKIFAELLHEEKISAISVDGIKDTLYFCTSDFPILDEVLQGGKWKERCEFIAPLDPFMWDRKLLKALFNFEYTWEIYTPAVKRKYGMYVLPILFGEKFVGRTEPVCDRKNGVFTIKNIWYDYGVLETKKMKDAIQATIKRFAAINQLPMEVQS